MPLSLGSGKWNYVDLANELDRLEFTDLIFVRPPEVPSDYFRCMYHGKKVYISLGCDYMLLRMVEDFEKLVDVFSKIVGFEHFCKYKVRSGNYVYEWSPKEELCNEILKGLEIQKKTGVIESIVVPYVQIGNE
jgi:hypothetical protein